MYKKPNVGKLFYIHLQLPPLASAHPSYEVTLCNNALDLLLIKDHLS